MRLLYLLARYVARIWRDITSTTPAPVCSVCKCDDLWEFCPKGECPMRGGVG